MKRALWIAGAIVVLCLAAIRLLPMRESQWSVLETSTEFTLYSLKAEDAPDAYIDTATTITDKEFGSPVYGKVNITDPKVKTELLNALQLGIEENQGGEAGCFEPRHAIRAVKGWRVIRLVICFSCGQIYIGENGASRKVLVTPTPQKVFDRVLTEAKVPLGWRPE